eukprot:CAMPEP_0115541250 /NCGR_PEP_ID=MMETSP0271-20121206/90363_1 /TAXON_ID=71861 /ORGANISM="Scrippsiella trochoidea, Strain CCMP3099" /LENGTH=270 /DNA_ID=CAMNT_0002974303 /DNA_START=33 /DNA_END=843 /DNA_ORIENTATION=-
MSAMLAWQPRAATISLLIAFPWADPETRHNRQKDALGYSFNTTHLRHTGAHPKELAAFRAAALYDSLQILRKCETDTEGAQASFQRPLRCPRNERRGIEGRWVGNVNARVHWIYHKRLLREECRRDLRGRKKRHPSALPKEVELGEAAQESSVASTNSARPFEPSMHLCCPGLPDAVGTSAEFMMSSSSKYGGGVACAEGQACWVTHHLINRIAASTLGGCLATSSTASLASAGDMKFNNSVFEVPRSCCKRTSRGPNVGATTRRTNKSG